MKRIIEEGVCPICGCKELEYGALRVVDDLVYYPWTCCSNAEHSGKEFYKLTFIGHNIKVDGDEQILEVGGIKNEVY